MARMITTTNGKKRKVVDIGIQVWDEYSHIRYFFTVKATEMLADRYNDLVRRNRLNGSVTFEQFCLSYMDIGDMDKFFRRDLENSYHMQVYGRADEYEALGYRKVTDKVKEQVCDICVHYAGLSDLAKYYIESVKEN